MSRRPNPEVLERLLAKGAQVVHELGYHACGVQDIAAAAKVPKGSFYSYFDSKESFASAILQAYWSDIEQRLVPALYDTSLQPRARIKRFFTLLMAEHAAHNFTIGCLIGNLSLELANNSDQVRATLAQILDKWEAALAYCIKACLPVGSASQRDAHSLAAILIEGWEGATLRTKIEHRGDAFERFIDETLPLVLK